MTSLLKLDLDNKMYVFTANEISSLNISKVIA